MLTVAWLDRRKLSGQKNIKTSTKLSNACYCLNSLKHKTLALPKELTAYLKLL